MTAAPLGPKTRARVPLSPLPVWTCQCVHARTNTIIAPAGRLLLDHVAIEAQTFGTSPYNEIVNLKTRVVLAILQR
jgi:hypothetical protein